MSERELRGVVTVGLLGTLEEVGWSLRPGLARIWAGERDSEAVSGCAGVPVPLSSLRRVLVGRYCPQLTSG